MKRLTLFLLLISSCIVAFNKLQNRFILQETPPACVPNLQQSVGSANQSQVLPPSHSNNIVFTLSFYSLQNCTLSSDFETLTNMTPNLCTSSSLFSSVTRECVYFNVFPHPDVGGYYVVRAFFNSDCTKYAGAQLVVQNNTCTRLNTDIALKLIVKLEKNTSNVSCNGISAEDSSVCNGKGTCVAQDNCVCNTGFGGKDCNTTSSSAPIPPPVPGVPTTAPSSKPTTSIPTTAIPSTSAPARPETSVPGTSAPTSAPTAAPSILREAQLVAASVCAGLNTFINETELFYNFAVLRNCNDQLLTCEKICTGLRDNSINLSCAADVSVAIPASESSNSVPEGKISLITRVASSCTNSCDTRRSSFSFCCCIRAASHNEELPGGSPSPIGSPAASPSPGSFPTSTSSPVPKAGSSPARR